MACRCEGVETDISANLSEKELLKFMETMIIQNMIRDIVNSSEDDADKVKLIKIMLEEKE